MLFTERLHLSLRHSLALGHGNLMQDLFGYMIMSWGSSACPHLSRSFSHCLRWAEALCDSGHSLENYITLIMAHLRQIMWFWMDMSLKIFTFSSHSERSCPWNEAKPPLPAGPWGSHSVHKAQALSMCLAWTSVKSCLPQHIYGSGFGTWMMDFIYVIKYTYLYKILCC